jgi:hypothetical protein
MDLCAIAVGGAERIFRYSGVAHLARTEPWCYLQSRSSPFPQLLSNLRAVS